MVDPLHNLIEGGIFGWVSVTDAQHRPLTQIATKGQKGVETIHFAKFGQTGVEMHYTHFCSNIGVEAIQTSHRPENGGGGGGGGGSKRRSICSKLPRLSTLLGTRLPIRFQVIIENNPHDPRKATTFTIVTCSAIWYETQQQCCYIWNRMYVLFV